MKVNLLRTQRDRLDDQITNLLTMSITAQRVVDQKDAEIKALEERHRLYEQRVHDENNKKLARKTNKK